jgi:hypothetical protein
MSKKPSSPTPADNVVPVSAEFTNQRLSIEITTLQERIRRLQVQNADLTNENRMLQLQVEASNKADGDTFAHILRESKARTAELKALRESGTQRELLIGDLQSRLADSEGYVQRRVEEATVEAQLQLKELHAHITDLQSQLEAKKAVELDKEHLMQAMRRMKEENATKLEAAKQKVEAMHLTMSSTLALQDETVAARVREEMATMAQSVVAENELFESQIAELSMHLGQIIAENESLRAELAQVKMKARIVDSQEEAWARRLVERTEQLRLMKQKVDKLEAQQQDLDAWKKKVHDMEVEHASYHKLLDTCASLQKELRQSKEQVSHLQTTVQQMTVESEQMLSLHCITTRFMMVAVRDLMKATGGSDSSSQNAFKMQLQHMERMSHIERESLLRGLFQRLGSLLTSKEAIESTSAAVLHQPSSTSKGQATQSRTVSRIGSPLPAANTS